MARLWTIAAWLWPNLAHAAQGMGVADGTASLAEQAAVIAFLLSLPLTLVAIGLMRGR